MKTRMTPKHLFFDMDGTITPSRRRIGAATMRALEDLSASLVVISGSRLEQLVWQIDGLNATTMGQNGNHTVHPERGELWHDRLSEAERTEIFAHIALVQSKYSYAVPDPADLLEDRGCQISYSIYGHNADPDDKKAFDGDFAKRRSILNDFPLVSDAVDVHIGGSTCLDYFRKGRNKGYNIRRLLQELAWKPVDCIYFGDALFPGGNDESVIGVMEAVQVSDPEDTVSKLRSIFS